MLYKASLSNKSEQNLRSLNLHRLATRGLYSRHSNYSHVELSWEETLGFFAGSTVRLLRSHAACEPGVLLVTLQAVQDSQCMSGALFVYNILAFFAD